jgi:hypothetical protein
VAKVGDRASRKITELPVHYPGRLKQFEWLPPSQLKYESSVSDDTVDEKDAFRHSLHRLAPPGRQGDRDFCVVFVLRDEAPVWQKIRSAGESPPKLIYLKMDWIP